jgi:hypothetical protein
VHVGTHVADSLGASFALGVEDVTHHDLGALAITARTWLSLMPRAPAGINATLPSSLVPVGYVVVASLR